MVLGGRGVHKCPVFAPEIHSSLFYIHCEAPLLYCFEVLLSCVSLDRPSSSNFGGRGVGLRATVYSHNYLFLCMCWLVLNFCLGLLLLLLLLLLL